MIPLPLGPFEVIAADPAWRFKSNSVARPGRNARRHYPTMTLDEICALPVADVAAPNAMLALWITTPFLAIGAHLRVMAAWGFKPSGVLFTWVKLNPHADPLRWRFSDFHLGNGFTTRKNIEVCLLGKRGRSLRVDRGVSELIIAPRRQHSQKPDAFFDLVERYAGERRRLEMFSRTDRPGWAAWGAEAGTIPLRPGMPVNCGDIAAPGGLVDETYPQYREAAE